MPSGLLPAPYRLSGIVLPACTRIPGLAARADRCCWRTELFVSPFT